MKSIQKLLSQGSNLPSITIQGFLVGKMQFYPLEQKTLHQNSFSRYFGAGLGWRWPNTTGYFPNHDFDCIGVLFHNWIMSRLLNLFITKLTLAVIAQTAVHNCTRDKGRKNNGRCFNFQRVWYAFKRFSLKSNSLR